jgi:hypothetical protein
VTAYDTQYVPLASIDTATDDPLLVRVRDICSSVNNAKLVMSPRLSDAFPTVTSGPPYHTNCDSNATNSSENVILIWPRVFVGKGHDLLQFSAAGIRTVGSGNSVWTLYAGHRRYTGAVTGVAAADRSTFGPVNSGTLIVNSGSDAFYHNIAIKLDSNIGGYIYMILTANDSDGTTRSSLYSYAITPWISTA